MTMNPAKHQPHVIVLSVCEASAITYLAYHYDWANAFQLGHQDHYEPDEGCEGPTGVVYSFAQTEFDDLFTAVIEEDGFFPGIGGDFALRIAAFVGGYDV